MRVSIHPVSFFTLRWAPPPAPATPRLRLGAVFRSDSPLSHLFSLAAGPHPPRVLTLTPRRGFTVRGEVWPQALLSIHRNAEERFFLQNAFASVSSVSFVVVSVRHRIGW